MTAATHRHAAISPGLNRVRPAAIAANGTTEVCAAKVCQPGPSARRRLASIDTEKPAACLEGTALFPRLRRLNLHQNPAETLHIRRYRDGATCVGHVTEKTLTAS